MVKEMRLYITDLCCCVALLAFALHWYWKFALYNLHCQHQVKVSSSHYVRTPLVEVRSPERRNDVENVAGHWPTVRAHPRRAFT